MLRAITYFFFLYFHAALSAIYLFGFGFLFAKNRLFIHRMSSHFRGSKVHIPVAPISTITSVANTKDLSIEILSPVGIDGNVSPLELTVINTLIKLRNPLSIFEMGTFDGRTTLNMAANSSGAAKLWTLDLPKSEIDKTPLPLAALDKQFIDKEASGEHFTQTKYSEKITQLYGDTATFDFSDFNGSMDLIFVDASHSYEYLLNDSVVALNLLKGKKGIILWHDYQVWEGVTMALDELHMSNPVFKDLKHIEGTSLVCLIKN